MASVTNFKTTTPADGRGRNVAPQKAGFNANFLVGFFLIDLISNP